MQKCRLRIYELERKGRKIMKWKGEENDEERWRQKTKVPIGIKAPFREWSSEAFQDFERHLRRKVNGKNR